MLLLDLYSKFMKFPDTRKYHISIISILLLFLTSFIIAQDNQLKNIKVMGYHGDIEFDGLLNEPFWQYADSIDGLTMVEPKENAPASNRTVVKIVADNENVIVGIICYDDPNKIIAYTKARDVDLENEPDEIMSPMGMIPNPKLSGPMTDKKAEKLLKKYTINL